MYGFVLCILMVVRPCYSSSHLEYIFCHLRSPDCTFSQCSYGRPAAHIRAANAYSCHAIHKQLAVIFSRQVFVYALVKFTVRRMRASEMDGMSLQMAKTWVTCGEKFRPGALQGNTEHELVLATSGKALLKAV